MEAPLSFSYLKSSAPAQLQYCREGQRWFAPRFSRTDLIAERERSNGEAASRASQPAAADERDNATQTRAREYREARRHPSAHRHIQ